MEDKFFPAPEGELTEDGMHPIPQPDQVKPSDREDGMGAYLMMFAALAAGLPLPIINVIASLIYYFVNRKKSPFVHFHCLQSFLSQLPLTVLNAALVFSVIHSLFSGGMLSDKVMNYGLFVVSANVGYIVFSLIAAFRAKAGRMYYFPFFGRIAYQIAFRMRAQKTVTHYNRPPQ